MTLVYIALGSNLASPLEQVQAAIRALGEIPILKGPEMLSSLAMAREIFLI